MRFYSILDPPDNVLLRTNATANKSCRNDVVSFTCSADAVPSAMSFQLFKDDVPMEISASGVWVKTLSEGGMFAYKCVANNSIGSSSSTNVNITVNGKWDCKNTLVLMLPLKTDLTDSSFTRSELYVACVASVSVRFRSKERGTRVKDRAKNGPSKRAGRGWGRKLPLPLLPPSIFWLSFHFSLGQNRRSPSLVFLCSETKRKRLLHRLISMFTVYIFCYISV